MRFGFAIIRMLSATAFLLPALAGAFCGLQSCPRANPRGLSSNGHPFEAGIRTRVVTFDIEGEEGAYGVVSPRFFAKVRDASLGVEIPRVNLHTAEGLTSGLGNPLLVAQYARRLSHDWSAEAGLQVELPFGDADHGLAGDHTMVLPWIGARKEWGMRWHTSGMLGFSQALGEKLQDDGGGAALAKAAHNGVDHGAGEAAPLYVNPHGDREVHWRAAVGLRLGERWTFEDFLLGQADITKPDWHPETVHYVRNGISAEWAVTPSVALQMAADAPVTSARRSEAALGMDLKVSW